MKRLCCVAVAGLVILSACAPGTDGIILTQATLEEAQAPSNGATEPIVVELPRIPAIRLPDVSTVGEFDELLQDRLRGLTLQPLDGVEVVTGSCENGETVYRGDQNSDVFRDVDLAVNESFSFEAEEGGSVTYEREKFNTRTRITTHGDGSGQFIEQGPVGHLSIDAAADGSGSYYSKEATRTTTIDVDQNGGGVFYRGGLDALMTITIHPDGGAELYSKTEDDLLTIDAHADGSGDFYFEQGDRIVTLRVRSDGSWEFADRTFENAVLLTVNVDRSGQYRERGSASLTVDFGPDGKGGPQTVVLPPTPRFVVSDRFPQLGTLASLSPPCATILRLDSALLFAVDKAEVLPAAAALLAELAPALIEAGRPIEVNGHTDATGGDEYNLDLSQRRAQAVADELAALGIDVDMTVAGYGETQPVAPNFNEDGTDNPAGQQQNRRVELVISE